MAYILERDKKAMLKEKNGTHEGPKVQKKYRDTVKVPKVFKKMST